MFSWPLYAFLLPREYSAEMRVAMASDAVFINSHSRLLYLFIHQPMLTVGTDVSYVDLWCCTFSSGCSWLFVTSGNMGGCGRFMQVFPLSHYACCLYSENCCATALNYNMTDECVMHAPVRISDLHAHCTVGTRKQQQLIWPPSIDVILSM